MKMNELFRHTFKQLVTPKEYKPLTTVAYDSDLCREVLDKSWLTEPQMRHAAERYRLGKSRSGKCIYWMIDDLGYVRDGHLGDAWASQLLKAREPKLLSHWHPSHCLFGLHLLTENNFKGHTAQPVPKALSVFSVISVCNQKTVCVVETERSAVILSEIFPEFLWMAYATTSHLTPDLFAPLAGHTVIIYPRTDPTGSTYLFFLDLADQVRRLYDINLTVDSTLEDHATDEQKAREIDLVDFIFQP
jgi:hypothetical protein